MPISSRSLTIQVTSEAAVDMAWYLALEDNFDTGPYFFDFQLSRELPRKSRYPMTDFLVSRQVANPSQRMLGEL